MIRVAKKAVKFNSGTHVVFDGNSLFTGSPNVPDLVMALPPFSGSGVTYSSTAISSQTWRMMNGLDGGSSADVDAAFSATRQNVLVCWEHTNAICNVGRTVQQTYDDMVSYIAARKAAKPGLRVLVVGAIPRQGFTITGNYATVLQVNMALQQIDQMVQDNRKALDVGFVSLRGPGSPFVMNGYSDADFSATGAIWNEGANARVHLNSTGMAIVAPMIGSAMQRLTF